MEVLRRSMPEQAANVASASRATTTTDPTALAKQIVSSLFEAPPERIDAIVQQPLSSAVTSACHCNISEIPFKDSWSAPIAPQAPYGINRTMSGAPMRPPRDAHGNLMHGGMFNQQFPYGF